MQDHESLKFQSRSISIYDQVYQLRGTDPSNTLITLRKVVDAKMRAVAAHGGTVDSLRVAVLASLNIADELECLREQYASWRALVTQSRSRSASLSSKLDEVFDELEAPRRLNKSRWLTCAMPEDSG